MNTPRISLSSFVLLFLALSLTTSAHAAGPLPTCTISASPAEVYKGGTATISWTTTGATSLSITKLNPVTPINAGSSTHAFGVTTVLTGKVVGPGGKSTCTATVSIIPPAVPFGMYKIRPSALGTQPLGVDLVGVSSRALGNGNPDTDLQKILDNARAHHVSMILDIGGIRSTYVNPDGTFSLDKWEAQMDSWCPVNKKGVAKCFNFAPYVKDGTVKAFRLFDEPQNAAQWGGTQITPDQIQQAAAYSKHLWPTVPTSVGTISCYLSGKQWSPQDLDMVLVPVRNTGLKKGRGCGPAFPTLESWVDDEVKQATQSGLRYSLDLNPIASAINPTTGTSNNKALSIADFTRYAEFLIRYPGNSSVILYRWFDPAAGLTVTTGDDDDRLYSNYWSEQVTPGITQALQKVAACAAAPTATNCSAAQ